MLEERRLSFKGVFAVEPPVAATLIVTPAGWNTRSTHRVRASTTMKNEKRRFFYEQLWSKGFDKNYSERISLVYSKSLKASLSLG